MKLLLVLLSFALVSALAPEQIGEETKNLRRRAVVERVEREQPEQVFLENLEPADEEANVDHKPKKFLRRLGDDLGYSDEVVKEKSASAKPNNNISEGENTSVHRFLSSKSSGSKSSRSGSKSSKSRRRLSSKSSGSKSSRSSKSSKSRRRLE